MRVELIPSTVGEALPRQFCTSVLIDEELVIDAGSLGLLSPLSRQEKVRHIFLSHSHLDHTGTLPVFLDNTFSRGDECVNLYANQATIECLKEDIFNDRLWPDFIRLSESGPPFLQLHEVQSEQPLTVAEYTVTPISVNHNVPTFGFIVEGDGAAVAFASDTGPTERLWEVLNSRSRIDAVFLECSFPNSHLELAQATCHLCPALFRGEVGKLRSQPRVIAYHVKPAFYEIIEKELANAGAEMVRPGQAYNFQRVDPA